MNYEELVELVRKHDRKYYVFNTPEISDADYDKLYDQLLSIEEAQGWKAPNSPTLVVGGGYKGKVKHPFKLYSLKKVYDTTEVPSDFSVKTVKLDGANISVSYLQGNLHMILTRGDGEFGNDITHLTKAIKSLPSNLTTAWEHLTVVGEVVSDDLDAENYRNYVSGAINLKETEEAATRNLRFIAHDLLGMKADFTRRMNLLKIAGFHTVLDEEFCSKYPSDGLVFRLDSYEECEVLGYTAKYPRWAVALKERGALTAQTTLQEVQWVVGRTGMVNPIGIVTPVMVDGALISRVTLHNWGFIDQHQLKLGDVIEIERSGGVIPKFIRVITPSPHNSRINLKQVEQEVGEVRLEGPRLYVTDQSQHGTVRLLEHFVKTLDIKGLGPRSIEKIGLTHPVDLYEKQVWNALGANGKKIEEEIERSKTKPYDVVLAALGIPGVGKAVAKSIVLQIPSFNKLRDIEVETISGIGPKTVDKILAWLTVNEEWVLKLPLQLERNQAIESVLDAHGPRKRIVITGKLDISRSDLSEHLEKLGFEVANSVTKDTYCLISASDETSSKYTKAVQYGITILDYWANRANILKGQF